MKNLNLTLCLTLVVLTATINAVQAQWSLTGNAGTNPASNFIGTLDNKALKVKTNNQVRLYITANGKIGIGTSSPLFKLDVNGNMNLAKDSGLYINATRAFHTRGGVNVFAGYHSGNAITTGYGNSGFGENALLADTSGFGNSAFGYNSLSANSSGNGNTAIGAAALTSNTTGHDNTVVGRSSLAGLVNGSNNTIMGSNSVYSLMSGSNNVAMGAGTAQSLTSGMSNTFIGSGTAANIASGNNCVLLGAYASLTDNLTNAVAIGAGSKVSQSNSMVLGDTSNIKVGIGSTLPAARLHVDYNSSGSSPQLLLREQGADYARIHFQNTQTGNYWALAGLANATPSSARMNFFNSGFGDVMVMTGNGNVGIGNITPAFQLEVATNSAAKPGSSAWTVSSDARLKTDVREFTDGLSVLEKIHPVRFRYNGEAHTPINEEFVGTLAQELREAAPYMIKPFVNTDEKTGKQTEYLGVDYGAMDFILINSVLELKQEVDRKEEQIRKQQQEMDDLRKLVLAIREDMNHCCERTAATGKAQLPAIGVADPRPASLEQNLPNPFHDRTSFYGYIPAGSGHAELIITSSDGKEIRSTVIAATGDFQYEYNHASGPGMYTATLIIDGRIIKSRQMVIR